MTNATQNAVETESLAGFSVLICIRTRPLTDLPGKEDRENPDRGLPGEPGRSPHGGRDDRRDDKRPRPRDANPTSQGTP